MKVSRAHQLTPAKRVLPAPLNIQHFLDTEPPPLDFVLPGFLAGTVGFLVAAGGVGKSQLALEAAFDIAVEASNLLELGLRRHNRVVILAGEDPKEVLHQRVKAIASHLAPEARNALPEALSIVECVGLGIDIMDAGWYEAISEMTCGARLLIVDTLTRFHSLDENDAKDAKSVMAALEALAKETGAAVLCLHHVNKGAALNGTADLQQAARGSSVFVDNARWLSFVAGVSPEEANKMSSVDKRRFLRWGVAKQNYGAPVPEQWYERVDQGVLVPSGGPGQCSAKAAAKEPRPALRDRRHPGIPPSPRAGG